MDSYAADGIGVVGVTVGPVEDLVKAKEASGVVFPIVSDVDGSLMDLFGLRDEGADALTGGDVPRPASVLLAADGTVIWKAAAENYRVRPGPTEAGAKANAYFKGSEGAGLGSGVGRFREMRRP